MWVYLRAARSLFFTRGRFLVLTTRHLRPARWRRGRNDTADGRSKCLQGLSCFLVAQAGGVGKRLGTRWNWSLPVETPSLVAAEEFLMCSNS